MPFEITRPLEQLIAEAKESVNTSARDKILSRYAQGKQASLTARAVELQSLNQVGSDEWIAIAAIWAWIKSVVDASNVANSTIDSAESVADIRAAQQSFKAAIEQL
ncbi:MAG: hypothetical protein ACXV8O_01370 [Methylobacter sp.]